MQRWNVHVAGHRRVRVGLVLDGQRGRGRARRHEFVEGHEQRDQERELLDTVGLGQRQLEFSQLLRVHRKTRLLPAIVRLGATGVLDGMGLPVAVVVRMPSVLDQREVIDGHGLSSAGYTDVTLAVADGNTGD